MALRKAYIKRHHEFIASVETGKTLERTPDDSLRYQSVTFSLVRALDKVEHSSIVPWMGFFACMDPGRYYLTFSQPQH